MTSTSEELLFVNMKLNKEDLTYLAIKYSISFYNTGDMLLITEHKIPVSFFRQHRLNYVRSYSLYITRNYLNETTFTAADQFIRNLLHWDSEQ